MGKLQKQQWKTDGVIVTVYESSSTIGSRRHQKTRATNSNPTPRSCGYDRRAELLAYAHQLRSASASAQQLHQDNVATTGTDIPKPKKKRRLWARLKALKLSFGRIFGGKKGWRYEPIETKGSECKTQQSSPSLCQGNCKWRNISKRMRIVLKKFSFGCKCAKGFDENEEVRDLHHRIRK